MATQTAFEVEHIVPVKHGGPTVLNNLAYACFHCNRHKGMSICGLHLSTGKIVRLFHLRKDKWREHFKLTQGRFSGKTEVGRITVRVLNMNKLEQVQLRRLWLGRFPP